MSSLSEREVEYSALAIFILSHGEKNNILMAADNKYNLRLITDSLIPDYCPGLIEKPKIIFIQVRPCNYSVSPNPDWTFGVRTKIGSRGIMMGTKA